MKIGSDLLNIISGSDNVGEKNTVRRGGKPGDTSHNNMIIKKKNTISQKEVIKQSK